MAANLSVLVPDRNIAAGRFESARGPNAEAAALLSDLLSHRVEDGEVALADEFFLLLNPGARLIDVNSIPGVLCGGALDDEGFYPELRQHLRSGATSTALLDAARQRALGAGRETVGVHCRCSAEHPVGKNQLVVRSQRMAGGRHL